MKCTRVKVGDTHAIVCTSRRKPKKCKCGSWLPVSKLCDWKVGNGKTCDAKLCDVCSFSPARGKDLCPEHRKAWAKHPRNNMKQSAGQSNEAKS